MHIFEETNLAGLKLKNRIIRSATHEGLGDEKGFPKEKLLDIYLKLARGGVGAIITGYAAVQVNGRTMKNMLMFDRDEFIGIYQKINFALQEYGVPLILQIAHGGALASKEAAGEIVSPSAYVSAITRQKARAMTEGEIYEAIDNFAGAIERAQKAGFGGVQLHAAHGYLLYEFLSPYFNKRKDAWGGSLENRFRIISKIMERAREAVGKFPILVKLSAYDFNRDGIRPDAGVQIARLLQEAGCDGIEVSSGSFEDGLCTARADKLPVDAVLNLVPAYKNLPVWMKKIYTLAVPLILKKYQPLQNYNVQAAEMITKAVEVPVIVVGGIRTLAGMEDIVTKGRADYVSLCRPLIMEPDLPNKLKDGRQDRSRCIDCAYCLMGVMGNPLRCYYGMVKK